ncbi:MAG: type II secretion system protein GspG [Candidatus Omnitrophota bacterium]
MKKSFTLIELMVVIAVIGVLSAVLVPSISGLVDKARVAAAQQVVKTVANAARALFLDTGLWPGGPNEADTTGRNMNAAAYGLINTDGRYGSAWQGPYLDKAIGLDPWQRDYIYDGGGAEHRQIGQACFISYGQDGVNNGSVNNTSLQAQGDDIVEYLNQ